MTIIEMTIFEAIKRLDWEFIIAYCWKNDLYVLDQKGRSILDHAVTKNNIRLVEIIIEAGYDVTKSPHALCLAKMNRNKDIIKLINDAGNWNMSVTFKNAFTTGFNFKQGELK